jgi:UDP-N-acetyl-D-galactosamine dehydrogenase
LQEYDIAVDVLDPWVDPTEAKEEYGIELVANPADGDYDAVVLAVAHQQFGAMSGQEIRDQGKPNHVFFDLKSIFDANQSDIRL